MIFAPFWHSQNASALPTSEPTIESKVRNSLLYDRSDSQATSAAIVEVVIAVRNDRPLAR